MLLYPDDVARGVGPTVRGELMKVADQIKTRMEQLGITVPELGLAVSMRLRNRCS